MKTLAIIVHPNLNDGSVVNNRLKDILTEAENVTIHDLYAAYPNGDIDVNREQQLLAEHDRVILQFPFWWYSSPSLLKKWTDEVLTFGWAYGPGGDKLFGKELGLAITTGSIEQSYRSDGYNRFTMEEMTRPFQATCQLIGMKFLPIFSIHDALHLVEEELDKAAHRYLEYTAKEFTKI